MQLQTTFNFSAVHPSWLPLVTKALDAVSAEYKQCLLHDPTWLPGKQNIFNAFSLPLTALKVILFGESPYPRAVSANGYAFYDANVVELWSNTGFATAVNRATSLRNFLKMLLLAAGMLTTHDVSQQAIAKLDKSSLIKTLPQLFARLHTHGFLLLNASLVLTTRSVTSETKQWLPFVATLLALIYQQLPTTQLLLWGNLAKKIEALPASQPFNKHYAEHPYNLSFITNRAMLAYFQPLHLLQL